MHFVFLFLHVAPLRSSVARPSSKTNTEAFVIVSRSLMAPLPCFLSTSGQLDLDLDLTFHSGRSENVLGGQFETHEYFHHPGVEDALAVFMGCAFFKLFFFFFFFSKSQARPLVFLDATWKSHPWYFSSVQCKPVGVTGLV